MTADDSRVSSFGELPRLAQIDALLLLAGGLALSVRLWPEWRHNPDTQCAF